MVAAVRRAWLLLWQEGVMVSIGGSYNNAVVVDAELVLLVCSSAHGFLGHDILPGREAGGAWRPMAAENLRQITGDCCTRFLALLTLMCVLRFPHNTNL